ncbi:hypothetical protein NMY22_g19585 [Coprinellus aureogranulatus]|nr:hypothetical protein NMY22_g19585 [Coprinellus aureogranulatus]
MSTDIRLDPSDPLNILLQNPVGGESSSSSNGDDSGASSIGSPQDWTQLSTLWDGTDPSATLQGGGKYNDLMDFNDLNGTLDMNMDMEFDPTMGLHYGGYGAFDTTSPFNLHLDMVQQTQFPFSFQAALNAVTNNFSSGASSSSASSVSGGSTLERRLSVGSSSSGASLSAADADTSNANSPSPLSGLSEGFSPLPQPTTPKVEVKKQESESPRAFDPAMELAERVRQSAGVMLAVPMNGQYSQQAFGQSLDGSSKCLPHSRLIHV